MYKTYIILVKTYMKHLFRKFLLAVFFPYG